MHPDLLHLGPLTIHGYGFMIVVGFLAATWLAMRRAPGYGIAPPLVFDVAFWVLVSAMAGSKLLYILLNWSDFLYDLQRFPRDPWGALRAQGGGFVFFGGLIAATIVGIVFARRHGMPLWQLGDLAAPSLALGHGLGRIGCFLAGCCYGRACRHFWAVTFRDPRTLAPRNIPLHPTQLYSAAMLLLLSGFLLWLSRRRRFPGQIFWTYVAFYSVGRFIIEFFRGDERGGIPAIGLSTSQWMGILALALAAAMLLRLRRRALAEESTHG